MPKGATIPKGNMVRIRGVKQVMAKLRHASVPISVQLAKGMTTAGEFLQRKSQQIVPVQTGHLKGSAYTRNIGGIGLDADIVVGYNAAYALFVHENMDNAHGRDFNIKHAAEIKAARGTPLGTAQGGMFRRGVNQQAKFLETPWRLHRAAMMIMIAKSVNITI